MKILVIGSGVIGVTYAWQLSEAGSDVSLFIKKEKAGLIQDKGIEIRGTDLRKGHKREIDVLFRPGIVTEISEEEGYELIIVPVNSNQVSGILPLLGNYKGNADIMFFHNKWSDNDEIEKYLEPSRYFFGFPFKAGGGRENYRIDTVIFGSSLCATMLGEKDGRITERVRRIEGELKKADMNPKVTDKMMAWMWTHYVWGAANIGAYVKAGSYEKFTRSSAVIRECYLAMREGFEVCRARGINPKSVSPTKLFYLPLLALIPYTKYFYNTDGMQEMFEGHVMHSPDEMKAMYYDILECGERYSVDMPYYKGFKKYIDEFAVKR
jgi:2-dehydropantoate 2-reductase